MTATCHTPKPLQEPSWQYSTLPILHQPTWDSKNRGRWGHAHIPSPNSKAYSVDIYPTSHIHLHSDIATSTTLINTSRIHSHTHKFMSTHTLTCIPPRAQRRYSLMLTQSHIHTHTLSATTRAPGHRSTLRPSGSGPWPSSGHGPHLLRVLGKHGVEGEHLGSRSYRCSSGAGWPCSRVVQGHLLSSGVHLQEGCGLGCLHRPDPQQDLHLWVSRAGQHGAWDLCKVGESQSAGVQGHGGSTETQRSTEHGGDMETWAEGHGGHSRNLGTQRDRWGRKRGREAWCRQDRAGRVSVARGREALSLATTCPGPLTSH